MSCSKTGLGLAVARRKATLYGGTITATDHPKGSAVFDVTVPHGYAYRPHQYQA